MFRSFLKDTQWAIPTVWSDDARAPVQYVLVDMTSVDDVFAWGCRKHWGQGFETGVVPISRHFYAALRHLWKWFLRAKKDKETGRDHLAHAMCRLLMMMYQEQCNVGTDDRPNSP